MATRHVFQLASLLALLLIALASSFSSPANATEGNGLLAVSFFDVGQGDAIHITTPDGIEVLIDGGPDGTVLRELQAQRPWFDRSLDLVVGTHQDLDHVAGLVDVLAAYDVATLLMTESRGASDASAAFVTEAAAEGANIVYARAGQQFKLGASTTLTILAPADDPSELESNTGSIVALLSYGTVGFMLTGDAPQGVEEYLVRLYGDALEAEVLKLGHHGSDTSTSRDFLAAVAPAYAIVSAGRDNRYGHPAEAVVARVRDQGATLLSTQTEETITFYSDGATVWRQ